MTIFVGSTADERWSYTREIGNSGTSHARDDEPRRGGAF